MSAPDNQTTAALLALALRAEAEAQLPTIDDRPPFERFTHRVGARRRRAWTLTVAIAAGAAALVAIASTTTLAHRSASPGTGDAPSTRPTATDGTTKAAQAVAEPSAIPASVPVTTLDRGPAMLAFEAFGAIWGTSDPPNPAPAGTVFRVSTDGKAVLSSTPYVGTVPDLPAVRAGNVVLVPSQTTDGFRMLAFTSAGEAAGEVALPGGAGSGVGAGDSTGAWVSDGKDSLVHVDATGVHAIGHVTLPGTDIVGVAVGGGSVWVADQDGNTITRLDEATGAVLRRATLSGGNAIPFEVRWGGGHLYVSTQAYQLLRLDPGSLATQAVTTGDYHGSMLHLEVAPDGTVWAETAQGTLAQLDGTTLATIRSYQVFPTLGAYQTYGPVVTADRVFKTDGLHAVLYSFPVR
jgi:hypothetical protein